jgi:hypothetical protein
MGKSRTKTRTSRPPVKKRTKGPERSKSAGRKPSRALPNEPSWIRPEVTQRRGVGRPLKLDRDLIERFLVPLRQGLHLANCAAIVGIPPVMYHAWLRDGMRDEEKGKRSIQREFSKAVRRTLAELHQQGVTTLLVYQRMAEGWDPTCPLCTKHNRPCGAHKKNLKLAADLVRWMLSHRFPREWAPGTVPALLAGDQDAGSPAAAVASSAEGVPAPTAFGAIVFLPARPRDDIE